MASREIASLKKVQGVIELNKYRAKRDLEMKYEPFPRVDDFGLIDLVNFEGHTRKEFAFYTMPKYGSNLKEYLGRYEGQQRIDKILNVCTKLVVIFKYLHCGSRVFNDLKP